MNERFTRLFILPENQYAAGSPVLLAAGALLRDNMNGAVLAQLKMKNLTEKPILAAKVRLYPADTAGRPLGGPLFYDYLDLHAARGAEFGASVPISLPNPVTRFLRAEIVEVIYPGGEIWNAPDEMIWEPLPWGQPAEQALGDPELLRQMQMRYGPCRFVPTRLGELWRCACGEIVKGERCPVCGGSFFDVDLPALMAEKDRRLAAERYAAEQAAARAAEEARLQAERAAEKAVAARAKRKKIGKILGIAIPAALVVAAGGLLGVPGLSAIQAGKAADAGDYGTAVEKYRDAEEWGLFSTLFHPGEKAESWQFEADFQQAVLAYREGRLEEASSLLDRTGTEGEARLSQMLRNELGDGTMLLDQAADAAAQGNYRRVGKLLGDIGTDGLSDEGKLAYALQCYHMAEQAEEAGMFREAFTLYELSAFSNYAGKMMLCNENYMGADQKLEAYIQQNMGGVGNMEKIDYRVEDGFLVLTVRYFSRSSPTLKVQYAMEGSERVVYNKEVPAGSGKTCEAKLKIADLQDPLVRFVTVRLIFSDGGLTTWSEDTVTMSVGDLRKATVDLYGEPVF